MKILTIFLSISATTLVNGLFAQKPGDLDVTFGVDGKVVTAFGSGDEEARSVVIQSDGKILTVGYSENGSDTDFALVRYNPNGSLDNTFGTDGKLSSDFMDFDNKAYAALVQPDGKIVVAGYARGNPIYYAIARYKSNGDIDANFGTDGFTRIENDPIGAGSQYITCLAIQSDLKIVAAGWFHQNAVGSQTSIVRYNVNGTIDSSFGTNGSTITTEQFEHEVANSMVIQPDGKILVAGYWFVNFSNYAFLLIRLNIDGSLDESFGTNGKVITDIDNGQDEAHSVLIQQDGKIVVSGFSNNNSTYTNIALVRYKPDGTLDNTFGTSGKVITDFGGYEAAYAAALQPDGKIVTVGYSSTETTHSDFTIVRYNNDGTLDSDFGENGRIITKMSVKDDQANSVAIQPDGKIVVAGFVDDLNKDIAVVRYLSGLNVGVLEFSLEKDILIYPNPVQNNETLEYTLHQDEVLSINLYDASGKLVKRFISQERRSQGFHRELLNLTEIISGSYILTIENGVKLIKE